MVNNEKRTRIRYKRKVSKWGKNTGWITVPQKLRPDVPIGQRFKITLTFKDKTLSYTSRYQQNKRSYGFSVPKEIVTKYPIIGKEVRISVVKIKGFTAKISQYKQVIIPQDKLRDYSISPEELLEIKVRSGEDKFTEVVKLAHTQREGKTGEVMAVVRLHDVNAGPAEIEILRKVEVVQDSHTDEEIAISALFADGVCGLINEDQIIIFQGRHVPIITPRYVKIGDIAHYMGAYFADGTKKGHAWRIVASTPEQAVYYTAMCKLLTPEEKFTYSLVYSLKPNEKGGRKLRKAELIKYWKSHGIGLSQIYILDALNNDTLKYNPNGSCQVENKKGLTMKLQRRVLYHTIGRNGILLNKNDIRKFILGVMEGDGHVSGGRKRIGLAITTDNAHRNLFESLLQRIKINFHIEDSRFRRGESNGITFQFGLLAILNNLTWLSSSIFLYYPKRRKTLLKRMFTKKIVQFLLPSYFETEYTSVLSHHINRITLSMQQMTSNLELLYHEYIKEI